MKKRLGEYIPILYRFFETNNIADDDVRTEMFSVFETLYKQYNCNPWKAATKDYLKMALGTAYRRYLINKREHELVKKRVLRQWYPLVTKQHTEQECADEVQIDLAILDDRQLKVVGRRLEDKEFKDIAKELGIKEDNVRQIHSRAVKKLRRVYSENKQLL